MGPIGALDEHIGKEGSDQFARGILFEKSYGIDRGKGLSEFGALGLRDERAGRPFHATNAGIGIQGEDQDVSEGAGLLQEADMAGVQEIVAAVGENNGSIGLFPAAALGEEFRAVVEASH